MKKIIFAFLFFASIPMGLHAATAVEEYRAGLAAYQSSNWGDAISHLEKAVSLKSDFWQAYNLLAYSYHQVDDTRKAIKNCDASLKIHPDNPLLRDFEEKLKAQQSSLGSVGMTPGNSSAPSSNPTIVEPNAKPAAETPVPVSNKTQAQDKVPKADSFFCLSLSGVTPIAPAGFSTDWTTGLGQGFAYGFRINELVSLVLTAQHSSFPLNYSYPGVTYTGGGIQVLSLLVNGKFVFIGQDDPVAIYLIAGAGPSEFISDAVSAKESLTGQPVVTNAPAITETDIAVQVGLGVDIRIAKGSAVYLEDDCVETFVSAKVASQGTMLNNRVSLGLKFDN